MIPRARVIKGAWQTKFAPLAYYFPLLLIFFWVVIISVAIALLYLDVASEARTLKI